MSDGRPCGLKDGHKGRHRFRHSDTSPAVHARYNRSAKGIIRSVRYDAGRRKSL